MNDTPTPVPVLGGGGMHPALSRHLQQQAQPKPTAPSTPATGTSPVLGGGGFHPAVAKHLQGR